ncbi:MAG: PR-1 protein [Linnemannia gamsii]|nr:MAG: PR-1 protein [Linnemannia gamsii]
MDEFTSLFVATVALLAASASAQVSTAPIEFDAVSLPFEEPEGNYTISEDADSVHLERRGVKAKGVLSAAEQKSILDTHNKYRARHGAKPLKWNAKAAQFGDNWIQQCQFKHSGGKYGENLAAGYKNFKTGIDAWYNEVSKYNYKNPGFSMATGHFTQVVWKGTKSVGCAKKFCPGSNWTIYICNYDPPGNYQGQYQKNVLPRKK